MDVQPINLAEFEAFARERLPASEYDFIAGGTADEATLLRNRTAFGRLFLRPRVLTGAGAPDLRTTVLGSEIAFPILAGPAGFHARAHPDGELATTRAAGALGTAMVLSSASSHPLEQVAAVATGPLWFQQYLFRDRGLTADLAARAEAAGCRALCLTLDSAVRAKRERNIRHRYTNPHSPTYEGVAVPDYDWDTSDAPRGVSALIDRAAGWSDVEDLAGRTALPIVVKGLMTAEDAALAVVVSNHGGRQLDGTLASVEALPEIVAAVDGRAEVYLDGGIRRGTDVLKALALGARAVLVARPLFWGLAVDGEAGVAAVLRILRDELATDLGLCGLASAAHVPRGTVTPRPRLGTLASQLPYAVNGNPAQVGQSDP
jgi:4-hydroxymandelate oxidase